MNRFSEKYHKKSTERSKMIYLRTKIICRIEAGRIAFRTFKSLNDENYNMILNVVI